MVKGSRHKARRAAVQALYQWQLTEQPPREIEAHFIHDYEMNDVDLDYFHHLVREIPLHLHELDDHISPHLDRKLNDVDPVEMACLRIGAVTYIAVDRCRATGRHCANRAQSAAHWIS